MVILEDTAVLFRGEKALTRVFVPREQWHGNTLFITGEDAHYITRVLRLGPQDTLTVLDGKGRAFRAVIKRADGKNLYLDTVGEVQSATEPSLAVTLFQAVPKGDKMDLVVQKATELGVVRIVPVVTERVVVRLNAERGAKRRERWRKISIEAARQCGRTVAPEVEPVMSFEDALNLLVPRDKNGSSSLLHLGILPWEGEEAVSLRECLTGKSPRAVSIFIGPEGGFSLSEVDAARARGIITVTLGRRILRTETAGITTLALVMYTFGEIG
ncbi:MAG: 16S rRNA (uracil(1498)-N(3))-methyltransferase [Bacillota bacterium]